MNDPTTPLRQIAFSYNWNNKLSCPCFTTIRLINLKKYVVGETYEIVLNKKPISLCEIVEIRNFYLASLNEFVARIDTGYSKAECERIIRSMYKIVDFDSNMLSLILLVKKPLAI